jgi:hypothetical protein
MRSIAATQSAASALIQNAEAAGLVRENLDENLDIVLALVGAIVERGTLSGDAVDQIIEHAVAVRSFAVEHQRRTDWRLRVEASARHFSPLAKP